MKKLFLLIMVVALVAAFVVPALAQRDRRHHEELNVAWALDLELQVNGAHEYTGAYRINLENEIERSFNGFKGIAQTNQSAGFLNNQANAVAIAVTQANNRKEEAEGLAFATSLVIQGNFLQDFDGTGYRSRYTDEIERSFNGFDGLAQTNQASGAMNNQKNSVAVAANVNTDGVLAASDNLLGQISVLNDVWLSPRTTCTAEIERSFNGGSGVAQTNQSPGSVNNQCNQVSVSYAGFETGRGGRR